MLAMVALMALVMRTMPRTKPQEIKPDSASSVGWEDIAGVEDARAELQEVVEFLRAPEQFARLGARVPRGVLLHGPPGTGKTLLAKAVAHESGARFYAQSAAGFVEMFAGLGAARVRRLFRIARKHQPAIIFIDELDAVGGQRGFGLNGEKDQTLNQLLIEMDGFGSSDRLVVIAASNLLDRLDSALLRPGRFDRQIYVAPPDVHARARHPARSLPQQAGRRRRPRAGRASDLRPDRRRPREHLQRGGDLRRAPQGRADRGRRLRRGARAGDRRDPVAARAQRAREARRRLPRGRPCAVRRAAAGGRPRPPRLDRAARTRARLHAQPARRGSLPEDARGADRPA